MPSTDNKFYFQLAKIRVKIIELNEDLDEQIRATEFAQAAETQKLIDELKSEKIEMEESMKPNGDKIEEEDKPTELKVGLAGLIFIDSASVIIFSHPLTLGILYVSCMLCSILCLKGILVPVSKK